MAVIPSKAVAFVVRRVLVLLAGLASLGVERLAAAGMGSADDAFVFRAWGTEAGLPQNTVNAIAQTREGYLWLGTQGGLARFDGVRFTAFGLADGLPNDQVRTLLEDREGNLWIGTTGGGLCRLREGRIETFSVEDGLPDINVTALAEDVEGRLWVGTSSGVSVWQDDKFHQPEALAGLGRALIRTLLSDRHGTIWISSVQGLFEFKANQLRECAGPEMDPRPSPYCLLEDRSGNLWASIGNGKVLCRRKGEWTTYNEADGLPFAYVTSLAESEDGTIWAGSLDQGLYYFDGTRFVAVRARDGLSGDAVRSLLTDREGHLWVGTRTSGLNRVARRKFGVFGPAQGLTNDFVRGVAESTDGTLWVATTGGGIYRGSQGRFAPFTNATYALGFPFAEAVIVTRRGELWWGGGGALFNWQNGELHSFTRAQVSWLADAGVTALHEDLQEGLWIGTTEGRLVRMRDGQFQPITNRVALGAVTALAQEKNGALWVGSAAGGLSRISGDGVSTFSTTNGLLSNQIRTLYLDAEGTLWIGTGGGGLARWQEGSIVNFTTRQGMGDDTISQILEDGEGRLWLGCNRGIFRVRKHDLHGLAAGRIPLLRSRAFGVSDGMPVEECSGGFSPAGLKTSSGQLCFSTVRGVVILDPKQQDTTTLPPQVLLEEALLDGKPTPLLRQQSKSNGGGSWTLTISPGQPDIEFHYTGLGFAAPEKIQFRYRLENYDHDWIEARHRRVAYYQRLPPGEFTFRVSACNEDGVWSEAVTPLAVTVLPHFWETTWFLAVLSVAVVGVLAGAVRLVERRKYRLRLARLETQHAVERERLRISQDMHDDIGSILTRVSILSDVGQGGGETDTAAKGQFERIGSQVRSAVQALDEIVWATNPQNDNLPRFAEYVGRFADECFENTAVRCWQEMPTDLPNLPLPADIRHNVFLAVKEAFSNVLKHAGATEVWLRLSIKDAIVRLTIEDNGHGFSVEQKPPGRNGLANMKARLAECGGRLDLTSAPGKGTRLRLDFPLRERS